MVVLNEMSGYDPACVKTHTSAKCRKYNSPTRYRTSCAQHDSTPWCAISSRCFYVRGGRWSFRTWGNFGLKPYSGFGNQLSRNRQGSPHGALQSWRDAMEHYVGLDISRRAGQRSSRRAAEANVPAGTLALVRSLLVLRCSTEQNALHTLIHQRHLTRSCGGHAPYRGQNPVPGAARFASQAECPKFECRPLCDTGEQHVGCLVEIGSQQLIAAFRDSARPVGLPGCVSSGRQSDIGSDASRPPKASGVIDRRKKAKSRNWTDAR